jgi:hypothetical protein
MLSQQPVAQLGNTGLRVGRDLRRAHAMRHFRVLDALLSICLVNAVAAVT